MSVEECLELFNKIKLDSFDYDRMVNNDCRGIKTKLSYDQFLEWNIKCIKESSDEDKLLFKALCNKIINKKIGQMDLEDCTVWVSDSLFFNRKKNIVLVHPR
jgi:hypothetical protein